MSKYIDADRLLAGIYSDNPKDVMLYIANFPAADVAPRWIPTVYYDGRPPKAGEGCMVVNGVGYFHAEDEVEE